MPLTVNACSWGDDEDFSILVDALKSYDAQVASSASSSASTNRKSSARSSSLPELIVLITGRGSRRDYYMQLFRDANYRYNIDRVVST